MNHAAFDLVNWPADFDRRELLAALSRPRLLLVAKNAGPPPLLDCFEDWVRLPAADGEVQARADALLRRVSHHHRVLRPAIDGDGRLSVGEHSAYLPPIEASLARVLVGRFGRVASAATLVRAGWPSGPPSPSTVHVRLHRLRRRVEPLGLVLRTVRARGWVLEAGDLRPRPPCACQAGTTAAAYDTDTGPGYLDTAEITRATSALRSAS